MKYQDMPDPKLSVGDVLVKVAGIGINPEDMLERNGDLKDRWPMQFPAIIGLDVSGTVVGTGDGVPISGRRPRLRVVVPHVR